MTVTRTRKGGSKDAINPVSCATEAAKPPLPFHLRSLTAWLTTVPNLMTYLRVVVMGVALVCYNAGVAGSGTNDHLAPTSPTSLLNLSLLAPGVASVFNQCVLDVFDGIIARRLGCCTLIGKHLDIGTDYFTFGIYLVYLVDVLERSRAPAIASWFHTEIFQWELANMMGSHSDVESEIITGNLNVNEAGLSYLDVLRFGVTYGSVVKAFLFIYFWSCLVSVTVSLEVNWKELDYSDPVTRFYYANSWNNNLLYCGYFFCIFGVHFYAVYPEMWFGSALFLLNLPLLLARVWAADLVVNYVGFVNLLENQRKAHL